jgi:phage tail sheath protein FI
MPVTPTYPGVYIEEIPSQVRTITGVATSVAALIGYTVRGAVNEPVKVFNFGEFERGFGGLNRDSPLSYAVQQYFLNGGGEAWIVRVADGAAAASVTLKALEAAGAFGGDTLKVDAASEGAWGNNLRVDVDYATTNPDATFNLTVTEFALQPGGVLAQRRQEVFRNLSMFPNSGQYAVSVVNAASQLVRLTVIAQGSSFQFPMGFSRSGALTAPVTLGTNNVLALSIDGGPVSEKTITPAGGTLAAIAAAIEAAFPTVDADVVLANGTIDAAGTFIQLTSKATNKIESAVVVLPASGNDAASKLALGMVNANLGAREQPAAAAVRPAPNGTTGADLAAATQGDLNVWGKTFRVTLKTGAGAGTTVGSAVEVSVLGSAPSTIQLSDVAAAMQAAIQAGTSPDPTLQAALQGASMTVVGRTLRALPGGADASAWFEFSDGVGGTPLDVSKVGLEATAYVNLRQYLAGVGVVAAAESAVIGGLDGTPPSTGTLIGSEANKTGIYALEDADLFTILSIPSTADLSSSDTAAGTILAAAAAYCDKRRAFLLIDPPLTIESNTAIKAWVDTLSLGQAAKNAAVYYPSPMVPDSLDGYRLRRMAPSGTVAGLYARTDGSRGVWKAPAGTEAALNNVPALAVALTDMECGVLNQVGINCLRTFPVYGRVAWGARTRVGADQQASEWKYVPVRRVALYIEESLYRGTQWVVFEPNDEPLWAQIRLNIGSFMHSLFRQGAFQGKTPHEAYLVKCDRETTTQDDINRGVVNIVVGFAPLKPAEFVIIQLQQLAGQAAT